MGGAAFDVVFGSPAPPRHEVPDTDHLIGLGWHHALHARTAIARGAPWAAEHWISALRDHALALACVRSHLPAHHAKGVDQLPAAERDAAAAALVTGLDGEELIRALTAAVTAFLDQVRSTDPAAAARLQPVLTDVATTVDRRHVTGMP